MNNKSTIVLAFAAGFLGGMVSRFGIPTSVHAQEPVPINTPESVHKEVRAHQFVLVDEQGAPRGVFGFERNGEPAVEVKYSNGFIAVPRWDPAKGFFGLLPFHKQQPPTLLEQAISEFTELTALTLDAVR